MRKMIIYTDIKRKNNVIDHQIFDIKSNYLNDAWNKLLWYLKYKIED
jgi:hypothetical protein